LEDWDECYEEGDGSWEQRVVHVEDEDGNIVAEDIAFNCPMIHCQSVIQRLREIQIAADPDAALALFIDELRTMKTRSSRRARSSFAGGWTQKLRRALAERRRA
jgi:hypothetical protein